MSFSFSFGGNNFLKWKIFYMNVETIYNSHPKKMDPIFCLIDSFQMEHMGKKFIKQKMFWIYSSFYQLALKIINCTI